jgi:hypothetical protein
LGFKFMHAADIHLDSPLQGLERYEHAPIEAMRGATRQAFENLVSTCLAEERRVPPVGGRPLRRPVAGLQHSALPRPAVGAPPARRTSPCSSCWATTTRSARWSIRRRSQPTSRCSPGRGRRRSRYSGLPVVVHGQSYARTEVTDDLAAKFPKAILGGLQRRAAPHQRGRAARRSTSPTHLARCSPSSTRGTSTGRSVTCTAAPSPRDRPAGGLPRQPPGAPHP